MRYPTVLAEIETVRRALAGASLARFGDGELRMALGGNCISQKASKAIRNELQRLLRGPARSLVCIPNALGGTPKFEKTWFRYTQEKYVKLYKQKEYGSSFITRPDSAPWINIPEYWGLIRELWAGKDITLVVGKEKTSLNEHIIRDARSINVMYGPQRDAYNEIDAIEAGIGTPKGTVFLCLGPCATVLAERLAVKGVHALDLGHLGRFLPKEMQK